MLDFWRNLRYGLLLLGFLFLGGYLITATRWSELLGYQPSYAPLIAEGQPIVDAVYRFKQDRGLWPEYSDDLIPAYLPKKPSSDWYYTVIPGTPDEGGGPSLAKYNSTDKFRTHVGFDFDPKAPSWRVFGSLEDRILKTLSPATMSTTLPAATREAHTLAEFDRRIKREPDLIDHWRDKISYLRDLHRPAEARAAAAQALRNFAAHYWPRLALAALEHERVIEILTRNSHSEWPHRWPSTSSATAPATQHSTLSTQNSPPATQDSELSTPDFAAWVAANPTYTHYYYLAILQRLTGHDPAALASLEQMTKLPMQRDPEDSGTLAYYAFDAARFALRQGKWDLVIALTDQWQAVAVAGKTDELSYLPFRAAALLARNTPGDFDKALANLDYLASTNRTCWAGGEAGQNLSALRAAIKAHHTTFRFDPSPGSRTPREFQIFTTPQ